MLVVADRSPLNILVRIGCVDVLEKLFRVVVVPPEVCAELSNPRTPELVRRFVAAPPAWLRVQSPLAVESIPPLGPGESAAISLARELRADALLVDEKDGRRAALARGLAIVGTLGILEKAATERLIDLSQAVRRLAATDFRLDPALIAAALDRCARRTPPPSK